MSGCGRRTATGARRRALPYRGLEPRAQRHVAKRIGALQSRDRCTTYRFGPNKNSAPALGLSQKRPRPDFTSDDNALV